MNEDHWDSLEFWKSSEWEKIQEQLDELDRSCVSYNPDRNNLFAYLDACPLANTRVAIFAQDPYPQKEYATGIALAIPKGCPRWPQSFAQIIGELQRDIIGENIALEDIKYHLPKTPDLTHWCNQGVLLANVIPSCQTGKSLSHYNWGWSWLTKEIIERLNKKPAGCVLVFMGAVAREFEQYANPECVDVLTTSHPSPRGNANSFNPFHGSRIFSTINACLARAKQEPIDWKFR